MMNAKRLILTVAVVIATMGYGKAQNYYDDDIYYDPSKDETPTQETITPATDYNGQYNYYSYPAVGGYTLDVDAYNRMGNYAIVDSISVDSLGSGGYFNSYLGQYGNMYYYPSLGDSIYTPYYNTTPEVNIYIDADDYLAWNYPYYSWSWRWSTPWYYNTWYYDTYWGWNPYWSWYGYWGPTYHPIHHPPHHPGYIPGGGGHHRPGGTSPGAYRPHRPTGGNNSGYRPGGGNGNGRPSGVGTGNGSGRRPGNNSGYQPGGNGGSSRPTGVGSGSGSGRRPGAGYSNPSNNGGRGSSYSRPSGGGSRGSGTRGGGSRGGGGRGGRR